MAQQPRFTFDFTTATQAGVDAKARNWIVTITNTTQRPIESMTVRYNYQFQGFDSGAVIVYRGGGNIEPGTTWLFYPGGSPAKGTPKVDAKTGRLWAQLNQSVSDVHVTVDAILFADGEIVGPDTAGLQVRVETEAATTSAVRQELAAAIREARQAAYADQLITANATQPTSPDPLLSMRYAPEWEALTRWNLGQQIKYAPNEDWVSRLLQMEKSRKSIYRREAQ